MTDKEIDLFLKNALDEDMPEGDITTDNIIDPNEISYAEFIAKENGVISGINYCKRTFDLIGGNVDFKIFKQDGEKVSKGDLIATIKGNTRTILKGERTSLNLLQYMSGIATTTNNYYHICVEKHNYLIQERLLQECVSLLKKLLKMVVE